MNEMVLFKYNTTIRKHFRKQIKVIVDQNNKDLDVIFIIESGAQQHPDEIKIVQ